MLDGIGTILVSWSTGQRRGDEESAAGAALLGNPLWSGGRAEGTDEAKLQRLRRLLHIGALMAITLGRSFMFIDSRVRGSGEEC